MTALFFLLLVLGAIAYFIGWIWTIIVAFKAETRWGWLLLMPTLISWPLNAAGVHSLGGLIGLASLGLYIAFLTQHWSVAKKPFVCTMGGIATMVCAAVIGFSALAARFQQSAAAEAAAPAQPAESATVPPPSGSPEINAPEQPKGPSVVRIARQVQQPARPPRSRPVTHTEGRAVVPPIPALRAETAEPAPVPSTLSQPSVATAAQAPLTIGCPNVQYDPGQSLQVVTLSLSNGSPKAIASVRMKLVYLDKAGEKLGEWITERHLDQTLEPSRTAEILQPAYHLPSLTKTVKVESRSVRFSDRTQWPPVP